MPRAAIGLGSNLGDSARHLRAAAAALQAHGGISDFQLSSIHLTAPVGIENQPHFHNAAAVFETSLPPRDLLDLLLAIEHSRGRDRAHETRWGPRTLDLDLLLYADQTIALPGLTIPHPRLLERAFALVPLAEIASDWVIPGSGLTVAHAARRLGS